MKKRFCTIVALGITILLLSLSLFAVMAFTSSPFQLGKLMDKPSWAGSPGGPDGGDNGDEDPTANYVLNVEIDYMEGHAPTQEVLDYIVGYYDAEGISVTFFVDDIDGFSDTVTDPTPLNGITDDDFWGIEASYNDNDNSYFDNWKWVLFGTTVEGEPSVVGYTYVLTRGSDLLAGNYIFIADQTGDTWASQNGIDDYGAEAVVLMHEMGHSIGIANFHPAFGEIYDPDPRSVMSYLSPNNAVLYWAWYYSDDYWATRNMEYYAI